VTLMTLKGSEVKVTDVFRKCTFAAETYRSTVCRWNHLGLIVTGIGTTVICMLQHMTFRPRLGVCRWHGTPIIIALRCWARKSPTSILQTSSRPLYSHWMRAGAGAPAAQRVCIQIMYSTSGPFCPYFVLAA